MLPEGWLVRNELAIRKVLAVRYYGNQYSCNICGAKLSKFVRLKTNDLLCPCCGSLPRNRRLLQLLNKLELSGSVLDFSPSRCLHRAMSKMDRIEYTSTDFAGEFEAQQSYDITNLPEPDGQYDWIICYHILEHVENDLRGMAELYRVLKTGGKVVIQTPFKDGDIFEDVTIRTPKGRLKNFGQEDHVRIYSVHGLKDRLEQVGFKVKIFDFENQQDQESIKLGLKGFETILIALK